MSTAKHVLAALTIMGATLCAAPAMAIPYTPVSVTNVGVNWAQGQGTNSNLGSIYYAGPITFTILGLPVIVWCDDFANDVYIGSSNQYYKTDSQGADAYLVNPLLTPTQQATLDHQIAGLVYKGTTLSLTNALTAAMGAQIQFAIWSLQNPALLDTDLAFQTSVNTLIGQASSFYSDMLTAGYTYGQLVSPNCGQNPASLTYTSACQTQGQMFVKAVPEPLTLSLFGAGLAGAAALRRRRKTRIA